MLSFCPFSFNLQNHNGSSASSPVFRPHMDNVVASSVELIPKPSSGFGVSVTVGVVSALGWTNLRNSDSRFVPSVRDGVLAGVVDGATNEGSMALNFCIAHVLASTFDMVMNVIASG